MKIVEHFRRISRLIDLIRRKSTGCPQKLAKRLDVSERTVFNLIDSLRELGIPVEYDNQRQSYRFPDGVFVDFRIDVKGEETKSIKGGSLYFSDFFSDCNFFAVRPSTFVV